MQSIGLLFLLSLVAFVFCAWFFAREVQKGERLFLPQLRDKIDHVLNLIIRTVSLKMKYLGRYIIKLSWYYGIHKALRFLLTTLIKIYDYLESIFMINRDRARTIKVEKRSLEQEQGHLSQMAEHKASTALSETQKKRLLQKKLERG